MKLIIIAYILFISLFNINCYDNNQMAQNFSFSFEEGIFNPFGPFVIDNDESFIDMPTGFRKPRLNSSPLQLEEGLINFPKSDFWILSEDDVIIGDMIRNPHGYLLSTCNFLFPDRSHRLKVYCNYNYNHKSHYYNYYGKLTIYLRNHMLMLFIVLTPSSLKIIYLPSLYQQLSTAMD